MHPATTRHIATIGITGAAVALALGTAAPAWAAPQPAGGNGNGNGSTNSNAPAEPPGQAKQTDPPADPTPASTHAATATAPPTDTATHTPPGQDKKDPTAAPDNGKGKASAPGQVKKATGADNANRGKGNNNGNGGGNGGGNGKGANGPDGHNPPGNNGTVKIHSLAGDTGHHNVPHPGCSFVVAFWGFDADQTLNVSFTGQAPTGAGTPLSLSGSGTSITSTDDAGGGNDPDGELVFSPTAAELSALGEPSKQGYHIRLDVATGEPGGHKSKVFWISPCTPETPPVNARTPVTDSDTIVADSPDVPTITSDSMTSVRDNPLSFPPQLDTARVTQATPRLQASPPVPTLPFTGANVSDLIAGGIATLGCGIVLTAAARRQRRRVG